MVRRVRLGRPDGLWRARRTAGRWTGPPPLLLLVTLTAFVAVPVLDHDSTRASEVPVAVTAAHVSDPLPEPDPRVTRPPAPSGGATEGDAPSRAGQVTTGLRPSKGEETHVGIASFNMFHNLSTAKAAADARRITRSPGVDVVGWQEAELFSGVLHDLDGWGTKTFTGPDGTSELAVSWRRSAFRLVSGWQERVIPGVSAREGRYPFGDRSVAVVVLEERRSGRRFAVIDAHLPPAIENLDRPGTWRATLNADQARQQLRKVASVWRNVRARWVVGTGDFNFDAAGDHRRRTEGAPLGTIGRHAVSSYEALGLRGLRPTYPSSGRHIDYVWVDRSDRRDGRIGVEDQWVLGGLHSDHNALVTRVTLR